MTTGIYKWLNKTSGKVYVGSAVSMESRRRKHLGDLRRGTHYNTKLQRAWSKYGEEQFEFVFIEVVEDKSLLRTREQHWIDAMDAVRSGYNILQFAGTMKDYKHSEESKRKISAAHLALPPFSQAHRMAISKCRTGTKQSAEQALRHSQFMTGRKPSAEHLAAQVAALRSPEVRAKISRSSKGRKKTEQHLANIRAALKRPEVQAKLSARSSRARSKATT